MGQPLNIKQIPTAITLTDAYRNGFGLGYVSTLNPSTAWPFINTLRADWAETPTGVEAASRVMIQDWMTTTKVRNPLNARMFLECWYLKLRYDTSSVVVPNPTSYIDDLVGDGIVANATLATNTEFLPTMSPTWNAKWKVLRVTRKWLRPGQTKNIFLGWKNRNKMLFSGIAQQGPTYQTPWYRVCMMRFHTEIGLDSAALSTQMEGYIPSFDIPVQRTFTWRFVLNNTEWHQEAPVYTATAQDASLVRTINPISGDTVNLDADQTAIVA